MAYVYRWLEQGEAHMEWRVIHSLVKCTKEHVQLMLPFGVTWWVHPTLTELDSAHDCDWMHRAPPKAHVSTMHPDIAATESPLIAMCDCRSGTHTWSDASCGVFDGSDSFTRTFLSYSSFYFVRSFVQVHRRRIFLLFFYL